MTFVNKYDIRKMNETIVLNYIVKNRPVSRADVALGTGLNKATISEIVKKLIKNELVLEIGTGNSTNYGGRRPILLELNKRAAISLSMDIGYNYIDTMASFLDGQIICEQKIIDCEIHKATFLEKIENVVIDFKQKIPKTTYGIIGITIAIHGVVFNNEIIFAPYYDLTNLDIVKSLNGRLNIPVFLENEANLSAIAENAYSSSYKNLVSISIHSGIGAGIMIDGELYSGERGFSGEIGHKILMPDGKPCPCGNHGCLEQYCSEKAILESYSKKLKQVNDVPTISQLKMAYFAKDPNAVEIIETAAKHLAIGINNLTTAFSPGIIFLNSRLTREIPSLIDKIKGNLNSYLNKDVELHNSKLGEKAILLGAATVNIRHFLQRNHRNRSQSS